MFWNFVERVEPLIFAGNCITPQMIRAYQPAFSASMAAFVEANYETEVDKNRLCALVRIGVGTAAPTAHLEIHATGAANPTTNGVLVHNFDGDSGDAILAAKTRQLAGNVFTSYIQTNAGSNPRGWSTGVSGTNSDFRITQNVENNKDPSTVGLYISGDTGRVGINTDTPRGALDVAGNVVIGNELSFGGLTGDRVWQHEACRKTL